MTKKTASEVSETPGPPTEQLLPIVIVTIADGFAYAAITYDGQPVDGEVRWWANTRYQRTDGGVARISTADPREFALTSVRRGPLRPFCVTARVRIDNDYVYSNSVDVYVDNGGLR
jgi:hypothetical protein